MSKRLILAVSCAMIKIFSLNSANAAVISSTNGEPYCREYTQTFSIGNKISEGYGTACLQPDGSWKIQKPATIPATTITSEPVIITPQPVTYIVRENRTYYAPYRPFRNVVVVSRPHHRHYDDYNWQHRW